MDQLLTITPDHLFRFHCQPLWIWYDLFGDTSHKEPISDFAMKLLEDGIAHEELIVRDMPITMVEETDPREAFQKTLELMKRDESLIYQGTIEAEICGVVYRGRPDLYGWILDTILSSKTEEGEIINREGKHLTVNLTIPRCQEETAQMCSEIAEIMNRKSGSQPLVQRDAS